MTRACSCSVDHADAISPITTIQFGEDAMYYAKRNYYGDIVSAIEQVVSVMVSDGMCVCECVSWGVVCICTHTITSHTP